MNRYKVNIIFFATAICCLFITSTYAQEIEEDVTKSPWSLSLGINISDPIINKIQNKDNQDSSAVIPPNVYTNLGYKKVHLRIGFGGKIFNSNNRSDLTQNISKVADYQFSLTASLLHRSDISDKFSLYKGLYFWNVYSLLERTYDSGFDLTTSYNESIGYAIGPGAKLEYHLGKRLSIFTEYCALYRMDFIYQGRTFSAFPSDSYKKHSSTVNSVQLQHPISIFLNYKF